MGRASTQRLKAEDSYQGIALSDAACGETSSRLQPLRAGAYSG